MLLTGIYAFNIEVKKYIHDQMSFLAFALYEQNFFHFIINWKIPNINGLSDLHYHMDGVGGGWGGVIVRTH